MHAYRHATLEGMTAKTADGYGYRVYLEGTVDRVAEKFLCSKMDWNR